MNKQARLYSCLIEQCRECPNWVLEVIGGWCALLGQDTHLVGKEIPSDCPLPEVKGSAKARIVHQLPRTAKH